jgi:hypothetical protein
LVELQEETEMERVNTFDRIESYYSYIDVIKKYLLMKDKSNMNLLQSLRSLDKKYGRVEQQCEKRSNEFADSFGRQSNFASPRQLVGIDEAKFSNGTV